jgi:hypothetical protein
MEYSPLFGPGFYDLSLYQFEEVFVSQFDPQERRGYLFQRFSVLVERF